MLRLFRYIRGYVTIKVMGYSPERFMNLCSNRNILLWNVVHFTDYYTMNISIRGFFQLRPIARKTKTKVVLIQRYGLPFLVGKMRKRSIFIGGIFGCILFLTLMSNYIWSIEVVGNVSITDEELLDYLSAQNIQYGTRKSTVDPEMLKKEIRIHFNHVIWDSVKMEGTKLTIEVKEGIGLEETREENTAEDGTARDIISNKNGEIVQMVTRKGIPLCKVGDTVSENQIIVSGQIPITGEDETVEKYQYCVSDADIYLRTEYAYQDRIDMNYTEKEFYHENIRIYSLGVFTRELTLPHRKIPYENYESFTDKRQLHILDNFYLPVFMNRRTICGYELKEKTYSFAEAKKIAEMHFNEFLKSLREKGVQIIGKDVKINKTNSKQKNLLLVKGRITVIEKIGESVPSKNNMLEENSP
ncbi:MAG: sporulation protein YqfD [Lachnospiraceae bacterium]|nr:sporulation protein YqfD [Lachnospiraceae bacterium]